MIVQLEGRQSILSALQHRQRKFQVIFIKSSAKADSLHELLSEAERQSVPVKYVSAQEIDARSQGKSHGGAIALCGPRRPNTFADLQEVMRRSETSPLLLLLEGVEDAQHLGYVLRTAEALGAHALLLKKHLWDFDETAVARASSGAFERLPLVRFSQTDELRELQRFNIKLFGCIANAKRTVYEIDLTAPVALAVGGEKRGLSGKLRERCDGFVKIPVADKSASSLSLTHAACLLLGEAARQRFQQSKTEAEERKNSD
jgi:23S rRNA (guanosine2251-2'-O)-methyltransferase